MTRHVISTFAVFVTLAATAAADEGMWLFTNPPRQQLKERYGFGLSEALLTRIQRASLDVGNNGSGSFVSPDGLVLTNHHVALRWLQQVATSERDFVKEGFIAETRERELPLPGLVLRVPWNIKDVTARVQQAIKPDMSLAQAHKARLRVLYEIENESRQATGLASEVVSLRPGARWHLHCYKRYTDVRLVFAPEFMASRMFDVCLLRAYENNKPARVEHRLDFSLTALKRGDLTLVSGFPGYTYRFASGAELDTFYDMPLFFSLKHSRRLQTALYAFTSQNQENARLAQTESYYLKINVDRAWDLLPRVNEAAADKRAKESARKLAIPRDGRRKKLHAQGTAMIASACKRAETVWKPNYLLESPAAAFDSKLFRIARDLVRLADESARPGPEMLREYWPANRQEVTQHLLVPRKMNREIEVIRLGESLALLWTLSGDDAGLAAQLLQGKTPKERARELVEGTRLDDVTVRDALIRGGKKVVDQSNDSMIVLARFVDQAARQARRRHEEEVVEPLAQGHEILAKAQENVDSPPAYPDATSTLRLAFGKVQVLGKGADAWGGITTLGEILRLAEATNNGLWLPTTWLAAKSQVNPEVQHIFSSSADGAPGNSGSPSLDRDGRVVGVCAIGSREPDFLRYTEGSSGMGAVTASGILEVLDKVYHAAALVKELGGTPSSVNVAAAAPPPPTILPASPALSSTGPMPSSFPATPTPSAIQRFKNLVPELIKALSDSDRDVVQSAATALGYLGPDTIPVLTEVLKGKDAALRANAARALGKMGSRGEAAIPALLHSLRDPDVEVRRQTARALAAILQPLPWVPPAAYYPADTGTP